ncbi:GMP/IMP nucleotidase [Thiothrix subterranea]|uniref:GMP/IMP nucleotidase n=1 Tax=Thiothrix subterranea TaxID=2735563 RepID=A0AA51MPW3_9GAMM|nr:GMP/IMP nucleotidase [Thiothrix subterranea]MDQ5766942.1 GMP/IMP nucleotidase [Thiothrix subterranea]WML88195.1 GMP/IMP nucleotidase [Thiothrix subterranea]
MNYSAINLDWHEINTVFLDMDGTLLDLHFDNHFWLEHLPVRLAEQRGATPDEIRAYLHERYTEMEGTLDWYCLDFWQNHLGTDLVALKHEIADRIAIRAHVERFLESLRERGKRVVLLTNAHQKSVGMKFGYVALAHYFDEIITSHSLGLPKEHPEFWQKLSTVEVFDPAHSLFIDDNLHVLRAAHAHGVKYLLAIHQPDSQQPPKDTAEFTAVACYTQLLG